MEVFSFGRGTRINTDRFPKLAPKAQSSSGVGRASPGNCLDFSPLSPLSWVSESFRQDIGQTSTWKVFLLLKVYLL